MPTAPLQLLGIQLSVSAGGRICGENFVQLSCWMRVVELFILDLWTATCTSHNILDEV